MENQKSPAVSSSSTPAAKPASPATPNLNALPVVATTTSKSAGLVPPAGDPPVAPPEPFREESIVLILSPKNTVHPMVEKNNPNGIRIFESAEAAASEVLGSQRLSQFRFAVIPLKGLF